jgi:hypothetical protein
MQRTILLAAFFVLSVVTPFTASAEQASTTAVTWDPPPGFEFRNACVPGTGERWQIPTDGDMRSEAGVAGPLYLVHEGRLVAVQYEVSQADLSTGESWQGMPLHYGNQALTIDHIDVRLTPAHQGFEEPHYSVYSYLVNPAERAAITC